MRWFNNNANQEDHRKRDFATQGHLSERARRHLFQMYGHLFVTAVCALLACHLHMTGTFVIQSPMLVGGLAVGSLLSIQYGRRFIPNRHVRQLLLYGFGFVQGSSIAPLVSDIYAFDPRAMYNALLNTLVLFGAFSMTALMMPRRSMFFVVGLLVGGLLCLIVTAIFGIFFNYSINDNILLQLGVFLFAMMVTMDTQTAIDNVERDPSTADPVHDAAGMLVNILAMLRRLMVLSAIQARDDRENRRREKKSRRDL